MYWKLLKTSKSRNLDDTQKNSRLKGCFRLHRHAIIRRHSTLSLISFDSYTSFRLINWKTFASFVFVIWMLHRDCETVRLCWRQRKRHTGAVRIPKEEWRWSPCDLFLYRTKSVYFHPVSPFKSLVITKVCIEMTAAVRIRLLGLC